MIDCIPRANQWDFSLYYIQSLAMRHGINPYLTDVSPLGAKLGLQAAPIRYAVDTPTFLLVFEPLTRLSPDGAHLVWLILGSIAFACALFVLLSGEPGIDRTSAFSIAAIMGCFPPLIDHFQQGQSQVFVLVMLALSMRLMQRRRDGAAGLILAAATLLRLYPMVLAGYLVVRGRWRCLSWMIAGLILGGALTAAMLGIERTLSFFTALGLTGGNNLLSLPASLVTRPNLGMSAFLTQAMPGMSGSILKILKLALALFLIGLTALSTWSSASTDLDNRAFALWTVTMLMIAPIVWLHYLVILLLAYAEMIAAYARGHLTSTSARLALASFLWIALWSEVTFGFAGQMNSIELRAISLLAFPGLLIAWIGVFTFARERAPMDAHESA